MMEMFSLAAVSYTYPSTEQHALRYIDVSIPGDSCTAILGPNGAGKSTLLDILLGWKQPDTGEVSLLSRPISSYSRRERGRLISLVPQNEPLQFSFSLLDYVLFGRAPYLPQLGNPSRDDVDIALRALDLVGLDLSPRRSVTALSGGQSQLLMIARAIAQQPEMIILDEPTSSLDPGNVANVISIMKDLREDGMTLLFTTHDANLASEISDHTMMLKGGKLIRMEKTSTALTTENMTDLYDTPLEVREQEGRSLVFRRSSH